MVVVEGEGEGEGDGGETVFRVTVAFHFRVTLQQHFF